MHHWSSRSKQFVPSNSDPSPKDSFRPKDLQYLNELWFQLSPAGALSEVQVAQDQLQVRQLERRGIHYSLYRVIFLGRREQPRLFEELERWVREIQIG